ncbi:ATP synthase F0 subunit A [Trebonia kvetii]|uniref:ATP synthase subunit a n=1 Tax=Trebonia kvetii TaxID=2480626 RepID=A0A6P2BYV6_9ACTN|nr:F0F1 ATP synthase subunit A [Trebonia kvetii]TVZ04254.1 ATP synthase F0 subunit A [Trebonia kvetii]
MTGHLAAAAGGCHIFTGCGYPAPGLDSFDFAPLFTIGSFNFTKPMLLAILSALAVIVFFWAAFAKPKLIPGRTQSLGEMGLLAVRDQILRPALGKKGDTYLPFIISLFFYILVCNLMELIPLLQFPVMARIGFVWPLVFMMYGLYWYLGFKAKGFFGYFRSWVPAAPWPILIILIPVEILKYVVVQPFTLGVRLFANMFAGHLLLSIFMVATWYLASFSIGLLYAAGSLFMVFFVFLLELLVDLLQAFIFTTLISTYIADSLEHQH